MKLFNSPTLKVLDFRRLLLSRVFTTLALQIQAVIVGWQVYRIAPSALLLGMIGLAEAIPAITCSFYSGHAVDTHRPYRVILWSFLVILLNSSILVLPSVASLGWADHTRLILLFAGVFVSGAARSFISPSFFSLIPQILPKAQLSSASAFNSSSFQLAGVIGPAIGGLIYGAMGATMAFCVPPLMIMLSMFFLLRFDSKIKNIKNSHLSEPFWQSLKAGLKYTFGHKMMLSTMSLDMFSVLFGGAVAVLPIFADQIFHAGAPGLGVLRAAPAIGSVVVGGWLAFRPLKKLTGKLLLAVIVGFGICIIGFALSKNFYLALLFLVFSGGFDGVSMVVRGTFFQIMIPEKMRGRISALNSVFITSSNEIGSFESGVAASLMGLAPSVIFGGVMSLLVVAVVAVVVPGLAKTSVDHEGNLRLGR